VLNVGLFKQESLAIAR